MKIHSIDEGFCRINYVGLNRFKQKVYYCLMDNGYCGKININLYRSTQELEPEYPVRIKVPAKEIFELPEGNSELIKACREWILNN